jgi:hypothetical protein
VIFNEIQQRTRKHRLLQLYDTRRSSFLNRLFVISAEGLSPWHGAAKPVFYAIRYYFIGIMTDRPVSFSHLYRFDKCRKRF